MMKCKGTSTSEASRPRSPMRRGVLLCVVLLAATAECRSAQAKPTTLGQIVVDAHQRFKADQSGAPASYIPELARVPADLFGIVVVTAQGETFAAGDVDYSFTIQSVSKPFTAALVMQQSGDATLVDKIGVEPTGLAFNSILATQLEATSTGNPLVNAGAIATVSLVEASSAVQRFDKIRGFFDRLAASKLQINQTIYESEAATNQRNRAHAYILASAKQIYSDPLEAVDVYTRQCAIGVTARQLAVMGASLANNGVNPLTKERVLDARYVPKVLALMMMAGLYDESGRWAYDTGLPAKTGVGGAVLAIVPGKYAIVGFSPRINKAGSSVRGTEAIHYIAERLGANVFTAH